MAALDAKAIEAAPALPLPCYKFGREGPVPRQYRVRLGPLPMSFTERTDKERKRIKMNTVLAAKRG